MALKTHIHADNGTVTEVELESFIDELTRTLEQNPANLTISELINSIQKALVKKLGVILIVTAFSRLRDSTEVYWQTPKRGR